MVVPETFWQVLTPLVVVITGLLQWALSAMERRQSAREIKDKLNTVEQKADNIIHQTNGVNAKLQEAIALKDMQATHVAELTEKDKQIATLTKNNKGE